MKIISLLLSLILIYKYLLSTLNITGIQLYTKSNVSFSGAYDDIPNIVHHYEIARRGFTSYEGNLVLLRRDSDNAELAFSSDANGDLDTSAITTWLSGANGFVVTVYDQVGSDNPTQATAGSQPAYVASGQNGKPTMRFDGTADFLQATYSVAVSQPVSLYLGCELDATIINDNQFYVIVDGTTGAQMSVYKTSTGAPDLVGISAGVGYNGGVAPSGFSIWAALFNGALSEFWINTTSQGAGNAGTDNALGITIGRLFNPLYFLKGDMSVVSIADPSHDATDRAAVETIKNDYYAAY